MAQRVSSPVDGTEIVYDIGPRRAVHDAAAVPVVLLHGSVLTRAIWRGLGYVDALGKERPVVRVDLRGHGSSGTPTDPAGYAPESQARDVLAVLDDAGIERAHLMGYSLGSRVALATALVAPQRVDHLVLLGGSASDQEGALDEVFYPGVVESIREHGMEGFCARQGLGPEVPSAFAQSTRQAFLRADPEAMAALFAATDRTPAVPDDALRALPHPALWMTGTRDQPRFLQSQRAADLMPHGRFVSLEGRTHGQTLSPADAVLAEVLPFLRESGRDASAPA